MEVDGLEHEAVWDAACQLMRAEMSEVTYSTWIAAALRPLDFSGNQYFVEAVADYYHTFVVPRYSLMISNALKQVTGKDLKLTILTPKQAADYKKGGDPLRKPTPQLNSRYTFDTFIVGSGNRFAHAASLAVADAPANAYNPFFIYGGVGLGKTHLMQAIGHFVANEKPDTRIEYVTSETFTIELVAAIQSNKNAAFREKYRNVDVLLIDDIQFIAGRDSTQEEFFHTFNALHNAGKQIIISSDRPPKEIARLEERLRSRFEWGLIADIQKPDVDTRCAILRRKATDELIKVGDDVLLLIAQRVDSNIRELEGSLNRLVAYASLSKRDIDMPLAEEALREVFHDHQPSSIDIEDIIEAVCAYYAVTPEEVRGPRRNQSFTVPRQIVMYLSRKLTSASLPKIGEGLGGRDHTTVIHGCSKIEALSKTSMPLRNAIDDISKQLRREK
ncbi:MAG: chromosomal replication initiator protein DnaA [Clostridiales bacterium]|nr:chromosomal replication initiator protein DnaA [Clostridiales bacterium]